MSSVDKISTVVIGSLNTDIVALGIKKFPQPGEHVYGRQLMIGPGGKSRNIADMTARLLPRDSVAMVGRTAKDKYGLWKLPVDALSNAGVNIDFIKVLGSSSKMPATALIPVDLAGENQIIVLPGISDDFSSGDIDRALPAFKAAANNSGFLISTLECPTETVSCAVHQAQKLGLRIMIDPGGIQSRIQLEKVVGKGIYLLKPNTHEAKIITGVNVFNLETARDAARTLQSMGIKNILITDAEKGAYLFGDEGEEHIKVPTIVERNKRDATGCGDQVLAAFCSSLHKSNNLVESARVAIAAGTLQFHKAGVQPVTQEE